MLYRNDLSGPKGEVGLIEAANRTRSFPYTGKRNWVQEWIKGRELE